MCSTSQDVQGVENFYLSDIRDKKKMIYVMRKVI